jgi:hypothetical protein
VRAVPQAGLPAAVAPRAAVRRIAGALRIGLRAVVLRAAQVARIVACVGARQVAVVVIAQVARIVASAGVRRVAVVVVVQVARIVARAGVRRVAVVVVVQVARIVACAVARQVALVVRVAASALVMRFAMAAEIAARAAARLTEQRVRIVACVAVSQVAVVAIAPCVAARLNVQAVWVVVRRIAEGHRIALGDATRVLLVAITTLAGVLLPRVGEVMASVVGANVQTRTAARRRFLLARTNLLRQWSPLKMAK